MTVADVFGVDVAPGQPDSAMLPAMDPDLARAMFAGDMTDEQWAIARTSLVDEAVAQAGLVVIGSGIRGSKVLVDGGDLAKLPTATVLELASPA